MTAPIPDPITVAQPDGPVPGATVVSTGTTLASAVGSISVEASPATSAGPGAVASRPAAQPASTTVLDLNDPWLASALALAIKAHIEAVPADAVAIKARGFALKTVGDLAQYYKDITPIVQTARVAARQKNVAARQLAAAETGKLQAASQVVRAEVAD